jgi:hypothetical protein
MSVSLGTVNRCNDGHIFPTTPTTVLLSVHFGATKFGRCPIDGKWLWYRRVRRNDLIDGELAHLQRRG